MIEGEGKSVALPVCEANDAPILADESAFGRIQPVMGLRLGMLLAFTAAQITEKLPIARIRASS